MLSTEKGSTRYKRKTLEITDKYEPVRRLNSECQSTISDTVVILNNLDGLFNKLIKIRNEHNVLSKIAGGKGGGM